MLKIKLFIVIISIAMLTGCNQISFLMATPTVAFTPTPTKTPSPVATATPLIFPTATPTHTSTPTSTLVPTNTPTQTPTTPTKTVTPANTATHTPTPTSAAPATTAPTAVPTDPPASDLDFRIASWRLWPLALNSGCAKGMHTIFIQVLDVSGAPLDGIIVGDSWGNVQNVTGVKGPGKVEIDLWSNTMEMTVLGDVHGATYTSEISFPFSSFMTTIPNEQMIAAGYCANEMECDWKRANDSYYCGAHYSWEVIFQKNY